MLNNKSLKFEVARLIDIKTLVQTYAEIAASRMQKIRNSVIQNRVFLLGLREIFSQVHFSYQTEVNKLLKRKKNVVRQAFNNSTMLNKEVSVLISSNAGLYGDIIRKTFEKFYNYYQENRNDLDIIIIGRQGASLFRELEVNNTFTYFDFPDDKLDFEILKNIVARLISYGKVSVFYGQFDSIVSQSPVKSYITGDTSETDSNVAKVKYIFEPSLDEIVYFFETEIFSSLFVQTFHESQLARYASRMLNLDAASEKIRSKLKKLEMEKRRLKHQIMNRKQLEVISGLSLWGKTDL